MTKLVTLGLLLLLAAGSLVGCGGSGGGGGTPTEPPGTLTLTVSANPSSIGLAGSSQILVQVRATGGGAVGGLPVTLATNIGRLDNTEVTTDSNGRATATLRATGDSGTARVTAQLRGQQASGVTDVRIGLDRVVVLTAQPAAVAGNQVSNLIARVFEGSGSPVPPGTVVTFTTSRGQLGATTERTDANGTARTTLGAAGAVGVAIVSAAVDGGSPGVTEVQLLLPYSLSVQVVPGAITAAGRATVTVRVTANDPTAPLGGRNVELNATRGRLGASTLRTSGAGVASTTLDGAGDSGTSLVTATLPGEAEPATATLSIGGGARVRLEASPSSVPAAGGASILTVVVAAEDGTPLQGVEVQLVTTRGRLDATRLRTGAGGLATTTLRGDGRRGAATVTGTLSGTTARDQVVVTFT